MSHSFPAIAVDAMGGDHAPVALVEGSLLALREQPELRLILVGDPKEIGELLPSGTDGERLRVQESEGVVPMGAHPAQLVRSQPRSSIVVAVELCASGEADACFSAGNSGAAVAAALLRLKRIPGIMRPAIATLLPSPEGPTILLDSGAEVDCRPEWLLQFGIMGSLYAERVLGIERPRVGLLSNGSEETKGNAVIQAAHLQLLEAGLNYLGQVEGGQLTSGELDVVVCDGLVGNVALKTAEGAAEVITTALRQELTSGARTRLGALLVLPALRRLRERLDWRQVGAAPLLGVGGLVFIGHGRSDARAVGSALRQAALAVRSGVAQALPEALERRAATVRS